jgi:hypothetical protein
VREDKAAAARTRDAHDPLETGFREFDQARESTGGPRTSRVAQGSFPSWSREKSGGKMAEGRTASELTGSGNSAHSDPVRARLQS